MKTSLLFRKLFFSIVFLFLSFSSISQINIETEIQSFNSECECLNNLIEVDHSVPKINIETEIQSFNSDSECLNNLIEVGHSVPRYITNQKIGYIVSYPNITPIIITDDSQFLSNGFIGSGTQKNPYILMNKSITSLSSHLISIQHTRAFFVIKNLQLEGTDGVFYDGIYLNDVKNGLFENLTIENCRYGVFSCNSHENIYFNNKINFNTYSGIYLQNSANNSILNSTLSENDRGIQLHWASNNTILNNLIYDNDQEGIEILNLSSLNKVINNTLDQNGLGVNLRSPECNFNLLKFNTIRSSTSTGIRSIDTNSFNTYSKNTVTGNFDGMRIGDNHSYIESNLISYNLNDGVNFYESINTTIRDNLVNNNGFNGIKISSLCSEITVINNLIDQNYKHGVEISSSHNNAVLNNTIIGHSWFGIYLSQAKYTTISFNIFRSNNLERINGITTQGYDEEGILSNNSLSYNLWADWKAPDDNFDAIVDYPYYLGAPDGIEKNFDPLPRLVDWKISSNAIAVNNDNGFTSAGFIGSGTLNDPYILHNYLILTDENTPAIDIRDSSVSFIIENCYMRGKYGIKLYNVTGGLIRKNYCMNNSDVGIFGQRAYNGITIINNTCNNNFNAGIQLNMYSDNNKIINNTCIDNKWFGIVLNFSSNNSIINNLCNWNKDTGINLISPDNYYNQLINNSCNSNTYGGIHIEGEYNIILNSSCSFNGDTGILIGGDKGRNIIENSFCSGNGNTGIRLYHTGPENLIKDNILIDNTQGISILSSSQDNVILRNFISNSQNYGVYIDSDCNNNLVKFNSFISNNVMGDSQAYDSGLGNIFVYNYWNNWTSPDHDMDCIIDYPYLLAGEDIYHVKNNDSFALGREGEFSPLIRLENQVNNSAMSLNSVIQLNTTDVSFNLTFYKWDDNNFSLLAESWEVILDQSEGWHTLSIIASDMYGIIISAKFLFCNDNSPPVITLVSPLADTDIRLSDSISLLIEDYLIQSVWYNWNNGENQTLVEPWIVPVPNLEGAISLTIYAQDSIGYLAVELYSWEVIINHIIENPEIIYPTENITLTEKILIEWIGARDNFNETISYQLYYSADGITWTVIGSTNNTLFVWDTELIPNGQYLLKLRAISSDRIEVEIVTDYLIRIYNIIPTTETTIPPTTTTSITTSVATFTTTITTSVATFTTTITTTVATFTTTSTKTNPTVTPAWTIHLLFLSFMAILLMKHRKKG